MKGNMNASCNARINVVVLKSDRLYGDLIRTQVWNVWPNAVIHAYQHGMDALAAMQDSKPDLFITGAKIEDMDGLEHLEPFIATSVPVFIVTSHADTRLFELLRDVRFDGIYDGATEGMDHLPGALRQVIQHQHYVSPSLLPFLKERRNSTLDVLTERERLVFSIIGDGSNDKQASQRLGVSPYTIASHRANIMAKLGLHSAGDLWQYALMHGYVQFTGKVIRRPGFQRWLDGRVAPPVSSRRKGRRSATTASRTESDAVRMQRL